MRPSQQAYKIFTTSICFVTVKRSGPNNVRVVAWFETWLAPRFHAELGGDAELAKYGSGRDRTLWGPRLQVQGVAATTRCDLSIDLTLMGRSLAAAFLKPTGAKNGSTYLSLKRENLAAATGRPYEETLARGGLARLDVQLGTVHHV